MDQHEILQAASKQLDRVLSFFPRVDTKSSFLFGIDIGLLGVLAANFSRSDLSLYSETIPAAISFILIGISLYFVYKASFPALKGGTGSLIYFREIAKRTEEGYIKAVTKQDAAAHVHDILEQVWRNSEILKIKYDAVKTSFVLTAVAILPWCIYLFMSGLNHSSGIIWK